MSIKNGIILLDKPEGITSSKAILKVKKHLGLKKIGHAGTLDPFATGLLVCATNSATKVLQYAESGIKEYSGTILFGVRTDTDDITGEKIEENNVDLDFAKIEELRNNFLGEIEQIPPQYSAIKISGKKAYELARAGEKIEFKSRVVTIYSFDVKKDSESVISFKIRCSKGTYIRSIARDIGEAYGSGACLASLRRLVSEPYNVNESKKLEELGSDSIIPWESLFPNMNVVSAGNVEADLIHNGNQEAFRNLVSNVDTKDPFLYKKQGSERALGMVVYKADKYKIGFNINVEE